MYLYLAIADLAYLYYIHQYGIYHMFQKRNAAQSHITAVTLLWYLTPLSIISDF